MTQIKQIKDLSNTVHNLTASQIISDSGVPGYTTNVPTETAEVGAVAFVKDDGIVLGAGYELTDSGLLFKNTSNVITSRYDSTRFTFTLTPAEGVTLNNSIVYRSGNFGCLHVDASGDFSGNVTWHSIAPLPLGMRPAYVGYYHGISYVNGQYGEALFIFDQTNGIRVHRTDKTRVVITVMYLINEGDLGYTP